MTEPRDLQIALALADAADAITTARFGALDLIVDSKPDLTPVSDADLAVETRLREYAIQPSAPRRRPWRGVRRRRRADGRQWVIDPIDGTKNFVRGVPVWATLSRCWSTAVPRRVRQRAGVGPALVGLRRRRALSLRGTSAAVRPIRVSKVSEVSSASSLASPACPVGAIAASVTEFIDLTDQVWRVRGYGDFYNYCLVAEGAVDIAAEPEVSLWDLAPLDILVREAGGSFTALDGGAGPHGGSAVATDEALHAVPVLSALRPA